jgi:hypothetical protein
MMESKDGNLDIYRKEALQFRYLKRWGGVSKHDRKMYTYWVYFFGFLAVSAFLLLNSVSSELKRAFL